MRAITRRRFLGLGLRGCLAAALPLPLMPRPASAADGFDPDRLFVGEVLDYDITFWWFDRVGSISLRFQRLAAGGGYLAEAFGQTHGIIAFVTRYRHDRYRTFMTYDPAAGRLVPQRFEEEVVVGDELFRAVRTFDHRARKILYQRAKDDGGTEDRIDDMPSPATADYLTAFYNFRAGAYGPVVQGRTVAVPTMPNQGTKEIVVNVLDQAATERLRRQDRVDYPYYVDLFLDPKLLRSEKGQVQGWAGHDLVPEVGVIGRVFLFGDIKGWLMARRLGEPETTAAHMTPEIPPKRPVTRERFGT